VERRGQVRYALRAPVDFLWEEGDGVEHQGAGLTRDVSQRGVFVVSDTYVPVAAVVRLELDFHELVKRKSHMIAQGLVLRVEPSSDGMGGFAVATKSLDFKIADDKSQLQSNA
jgi:hypothetical protein